CLYAAEAEIQASFFKEYTLEFNAVRISLLCKLIYQRSSRISKPQDSGNFVVCFSGRIISRRSKHTAFIVSRHLNYIGVSSRYNQRHEWRLQIFMLHVICTYVSVYMMHSYERFARRQRICFCSGDPYEERPHTS